MLRRPGLARGDRGLVLALNGPVHGAEVGFELAPPSRHRRRLLRRLHLASSSDLGLGLGCGFPDGVCPVRPRLVGGVHGLEPDRLRGQPAGQGPGVRDGWPVVRGRGVGGLAPGVGLGLGGGS
jgi:hypothetical protein